MAQAKTYWLDHVVEKPHTYRETTNADGTTTHTDAFGKVIQQGTPINAANLNKLENTVLYLHAAFDMASTLQQADIRAVESRTAANTEHALQQMRILLDLISTLHQAQFRGNEKRITALEAKVKELGEEG